MITDIPLITALSSVNAAGINALTHTVAGSASPKGAYSFGRHKRLMACCNVA